MKKSTRKNEKKRIASKLLVKGRGHKFWDTRAQWAQPILFPPLFGRGRRNTAKTKLPVLGNSTNFDALWWREYVSTRKLSRDIICSKLNVHHTIIKKLSNTVHLSWFIALRSTSSPPHVDSLPRRGGTFRHVIWELIFYSCTKFRSCRIFDVLWRLIRPKWHAFHSYRESSNQLPSRLQHSGYCTSHATSITQRLAPHR